MFYCEEANRLHQQTIRLLAEHSGFDHELRMTPKNSREYAQKKRELKKAVGRLRETHKQFDNHVKEHGCRPR